MAASETRKTGFTAHKMRIFNGQWRAKASLGAPRFTLRRLWLCPEGAYTRIRPLRKHRKTAMQYKHQLMFV